VGEHHTTISSSLINLIIINRPTDGSSDHHVFPSTTLIALVATLAYISVRQFIIRRQLPFTMAANQ
jgi:hypothetical protein